MTRWGDLTQVSVVVLGLIQASEMGNTSMSSEINFELAGYLLDIDLMFAEETFKDLKGAWIWVDVPCKPE